VVALDARDGVNFVYIFFVVINDVLRSARLASPRHLCDRKRDLAQAVFASPRVAVDSYGMKTIRRSTSMPLRADALSTTWNRWKFRGVEKVRDQFRATLGNHAWRSPYFDTAAEAAAAYDTMARKVYGERAFLNFAGPNEQQVMPADDVTCHHGHSRALHTYFRPNGKPGYCRLCNKLAQMRSKERRRT
jgi:hypothetical protein